MEYGLLSVRQYQRQDGVALAIVVWFLAAMSLLASGIVYLGRVDVQLAQAHVARAKVAAAGDGAIQLMMERFVSSPLEGQQRAGQLPLTGRFVLGDTFVDVRMTGASGLVDVFDAPPGLLAGLLAFRGGLSAAEAKQLADNVIELRNSGGRTRMGERFTAAPSSPEDLLRIPGFNRALYDAIADDVRGVRGGAGSFNPAAAPEDLRQVLKAAESAGAGKLVGRIAVGGGNWNPRSEELFRVDAVVRYGDRHWLRRRWIKMVPGPGSDLPWRPVRTESPRALARNFNNEAEQN